MSYISDNLAMFSSIIKCIAKQFGPNCEVVVHDLTLPYDRTLVAIENGHITNRKIGDSGTNIGLEVLRGTAEGVDRYNYVNQTRDGRVLRSSSTYISDTEGKVCGCICINFDVTDFILAGKAVSYFASLNSEDKAEEFFTGNIDDLMDSMLQEAVRNTGRIVAEMTKEDKLACVRYLDQKGAFLVKKSAEKTAKYLRISKFTLYNYLDEIRTPGP